MHKVVMTDGDIKIIELAYAQLQTDRHRYGMELKYMVDEVSRIIDSLYAFKQSFLTLKSIERDGIYRISAYYEINMFTETGERHKVVDFSDCTPETLSLEIAIEKKHDTDRASVIIERSEQKEEEDSIDEKWVRIKEETMNGTGKSFQKHGKKIIEGLNLSGYGIDIRKTRIPTIDDDYANTFFHELNGLDFLKKSETPDNNQITQIKDMMNQSYVMNSRRIGRNTLSLFEDLFFKEDIYKVSSNGKWLRLLFDMHGHNLESNIPGYENCRWFELITRFDNTEPKHGEKQCFLRIFENEDVQNPWLFCIESFNGIDNMKKFFDGLFISIMGNRRKEDKRFFFVVRDVFGHFQGLREKIINGLSEKYGINTGWTRCDYVHNITDIEQATTPPELQYRATSNFFLEFDPDNSNYRARDAKHMHTRLLIKTIYFSEGQTNAKIIIHFINKQSCEILNFSIPYYYNNNDGGVEEGFIVDLFENFIDKYFTERKHSLSGEGEEPEREDTNKRRRESENGTYTEEQRTNLKSLFHIEMITSRLIKLMSNS